MYLGPQQARVRREALGQVDLAVDDLLDDALLDRLVLREELDVQLAGRRDRDLVLLALDGEVALLLEEVVVRRARLDRDHRNDNRDADHIHLLFGHGAATKKAEKGAGP